MKFTIALVALATVSTTVSAQSCTSELEAAGGWFRTEDSKWFKDSATAPCVGQCVSFAESQPFIREVAGQTIEEPKDSWFDAENKYWCATVSGYDDEGSNKKKWGYCACPRTCDSFTKREQCTYSSGTSTPTECSWQKGACIVKPSCVEANEAVPAGKLQKFCQEEKCFFAANKCSEAPTTCAAVNELFNANNARFRKTCNAVAGCFVRSGSCIEIPSTCDEVNALKLNNPGLRNVCEKSAEGCYAVRTTCKPLPTTCAQVNTDLAQINKQSNFFAKSCNGVSGCAVHKNSCMTAPTTCDAVNGIYPNISQKKRQVCRNLDGLRCDIVSGSCTEIESCAFYKGVRARCIQALDCGFRAGHCCPSDSPCFSYTGAECKENSDSCVWKGLPGKKKCTCLNSE